MAATEALLGAAELKFRLDIGAKETHERFAIAEVVANLEEDAKSALSVGDRETDTASLLLESTDLLVEPLHVLVRHGAPATKVISVVAEGLAAVLQQVAA